MKRVSGVLSFAQFDLGGQPVYIFGENHEMGKGCQDCKQPECMTFLDFIELHEKKNKQLQKLVVLIENPHTYETLEKVPRLAHVPAEFHRGNISKLKQTYLYCMYESNKQQCSLQNVFILPCDLRNSKNQQIQNQEFLTFSLPFMKLFEMLKNEQQAHSEAQELHRNFIQSPANTLFLWIIQGNGELGTLYSELKRKRLIDDKILLELLNKMQTFYESNKESKASQTKLLRLIDNQENNISSEDVYNFLSSFVCMLMDTFIIFQIFFSKFV